MRDRLKAANVDKLKRWAFGFALLLATAAYAMGFVAAIPWSVRMTFCGLGVMLYIWVMGMWFYDKDQPIYGSRVRWLARQLWSMVVFLCHYLAVAMILWTVYYHHPFRWVALAVSVMATGVVTGHWTRKYRQRRRRRHLDNLNSYN